MNAREREGHMKVKGERVKVMDRVLVFVRVLERSGVWAWT